MCKSKRSSSIALQRALALCLASALPTLASAADLSGVVSDPTLGRYVGGASVRIEELDRVTTTDRSGRYVFRDLPAGEYTVIARVSGYPPATARVTVPETGATTADVSLAAPAGVGAALEEIVVTGSRVSQLLSLQRKRAADSIVDVVSADMVGRLPDYNAAEAVQRLPGVSVEIDQGEGRYPVIRGIDSNLNIVTVDGNLVGAPEAEGRRVALDTVPSDLVAAIEVVKAVTPNLDGNAVGGIINIVTPSAFDRPDSFLNARAQAGYNEKSESTPYGASLSYGSAFGANEQFGIVLAGSYYDRRFDSDLVEGIDWLQPAAATNPDIFAPGTARLFDYEIRRIRSGAVLNLEFQPSDNVQFYWRNIFNEFSDEEGRDQLDYDYRRGTQTVISPTQISYSRGRATREFRQNDQTQQLINVSPGGEINFGDFTWGFNYTFAHAEEMTPTRIDWEFRSNDNLANTIDLSDEFFVIRPNSTAAVAPVNDPGNYPFRRVFFRTEQINENINSGKTDLRYDLDFGSAPGYLQGGFKYVNRGKRRNSDRSEFNPTTPFTLAAVGLAPESPDDFQDGRYVFGPALDFPALQEFFAANPGRFRLNAISTRVRGADADYVVDEDVAAAYFMGSATFGDVNVIAGTRVERTDARYDAFQVLSGADRDGDGDIDVNDVLVTPVAGENRYTNWLPSVHFKWTPRENLAVRAAWTNTIGRPNYDQLAPISLIDDDEAEVGNPNLAPFESMGLDLSVEYYLQPTGILGAGMFYKQIDNPIFIRRTLNTTVNGIPVSSLDQPENADNGSLLGIEVQWQQQFTFLPAPFNGFGIVLNATYVDSDVDVLGRETDELPFFRQSDVIANAALTFVRGGFEASIAATHRDEYLQILGGNVAEDNYFDERTQLDFKASYRLLDNFTIFGEVQNLTDESRREYQGISERLFADEIYSWTATLGLSASF